MGAKAVAFVQQVRLADLPTTTHKALMLVLAWFADDAGGIIAPGIVEAIEDGRLQLHTKTQVKPNGSRRVVVVRTAQGRRVATIAMDPPSGRESAS